MKQFNFDTPHKFFFETLGNQTRWDIIRLLQKKHCRVTDIAKRLSYEQSLISHHLKRLEICGFVNVETNGTERIYYVNRKTIAPLLKLVDRHVNQFCKKACCKN